MRDDSDDLGWSIKATAAKTSEAPCTVRNYLRDGHYEAVKRGRRTIILPDSVRRYWATLPKAKFGADSDSAQPRSRGKFAASTSTTA